MTLIIYSVNPMYYVGFSSATLVASLILFQGFNTTDATNTVSLLAGFVVTFLGVHLLNLSRKPDPITEQNGHSSLEGGLMNPRLSLQGRMSLDAWHTSESGTPRTMAHGRRSSLYRAQSSALYSAFENGENGLAESIGLRELREEDEAEDDEDADELTQLRSAHEQKVRDRHRSRSSSHSPIVTSLDDARLV